MKTTQALGGHRTATSPRSAKGRTAWGRSVSGAQADRDSPFRASYRDAHYYSTGRNWNDYAPAYRYGAEAFARHAGKTFEEVERLLEQAWDEVKQGSRLVWVEARSAVHEAWRQAEAEAFPCGHPAPAAKRNAAD